MNQRKPVSLTLHVALVAAVVLLAGAGCTLFPTAQPPPRLFVLTPKSTFSKDLPTAGWQLTVGLPVADTGLNTARIALRRSPVSLEYFERANWIDTAPSMVQTLLLESFGNSNRIVAVGRQSVSLRADYSLLLELREFQAEYGADGVPSARVRINVKLVKMPQRNIIASIAVQKVVKARGADMVSVVEAFDAALGKALKRIVEWTLRTAPPKPPR
jgi:cholesterol transport system auxiliary component